MAYATIDDIEVRWHPLNDDELTRATALLDDASVMLTALVRVDDSDEQQAEVLRKVTCNMVIRAMVAYASSAFGIDQVQATMGPFAQSTHFSNPTGDLYLTKFEKQLLGIIGKGGKGRVLYPTVGGDLVAQLPNAL